MSPNETVFTDQSERQRAAGPAPAEPQPPSEEPTYLVRERLLALGERIAKARRFADACRRAAARRGQWAEGKLFSFDPELDADWQAARKPELSVVEAFGPIVERKRPTDAAAWGGLHDAVTGLIGTLVDSLPARRLARALPGLWDDVDAVAADHPAVRELAGLLAVQDDAVFVVIHPATGSGFRVQASGVEDTFQLHVLIADLLAGPAGGLPAERPDPRVVAVYRGVARIDGLVADAAFGLYAGSALRPDGTLPEGISGCEHWLWGASSPATIPYFAGERIILLGTPPFRMTWEVERRFTELRASVRLIECLDPGVVRDWLQRLAGCELPAVGDPSRRLAA